MPGTPSRWSTALRSVAPRALQEELGPFAAAKSTNRSNMTSHGGIAASRSNKTCEIEISPCRSARGTGPPMDRALACFHSVDILVSIRLLPGPNPVLTARSRPNLIRYKPRPCRSTPSGDRSRSSPVDRPIRPGGFLRGRQPLAELRNGVTSSMALIKRPEGLDSRRWRRFPARPGPLTLTSTSLTPHVFGSRGRTGFGGAQAANGVLLRLPLNPTVPDEAQHNTSAIGVGNRHRRVVECRLDVHDRPADVASCLAFLGLGHGCVAPGLSRSIVLPQFLDALLTGNRLAGPPCESVRWCGCGLAANRQPLAVPRGLDNSRCRAAERCSVGPGGEADPRPCIRCQRARPAQPGVVV